MPSTKHKITNNNKKNPYISQRMTIFHGRKLGASAALLSSPTTKPESNNLPGRAVIRLSQLEWPAAVFVIDKESIKINEFSLLVMILASLALLVCWLGEYLL